MSRDYGSFLEAKRRVDPMTGLADVPILPDQMFGFQRDITSWALRRGRAALFAGTGLGKSFMELAWADAVHRETGKDILHLAPLSVSAQMVREADKFGMSARHVRNQSECLPGTNITNYQKLDHFDVGAFGGVILDESSILKSTDGHYRTKLIESCAAIPFRLAATATPAPNDFMELGNHAEFLGVMSYTDMLATFFTHDGGETQKWRLKGHAEDDFWKWMASWAVMLRKPSDLGYEDGGYNLPPLNQIQHQVAVDYAPSIETGMLFPMEASNLQERIAARRDTVSERVNLAKQIVIGSFGDKLAAWYGNRNTPNVAASAQKPTSNIGQSETSNLQPTKSGEQNTCASIDATTSTNGSARQSSKTKSTPAVESGTQSMQSTGSTPRLSPESGRQSSDENNYCGRNTSSLLPSTTNCSECRTEAAQSADVGTTASGSTSTTATMAGMSEVCSARHATPASVISKTTLTASPEPSNTFAKLEPWVVWCQLNSEQDALKRAFGDLAISIHGGHSEEEKEKLHQDWLDGKAPILIVKPSMFGHGLNWQHCNQCVFVGLNDSFEQVYQAIRRFWRFGQTKPVTVHFIASELEGAVVANLRRKEADADRMAAAMVRHMADLSSQQIRGTIRTVADYSPTKPFIIPSFIGGSHAAA